MNDSNHDIVPTLRMYDGVMMKLAADEIEVMREQIHALRDLLKSARAIAERQGVDTHWQRFSDRLAAAGISPVTSLTFRILPSDRQQE